MNKRCQELWEGVVELAEGRPSPEAAAHVETCASCAAKLETLREAMRLGDLRFFDASPALVEAAKAMMPAPRRLPLLRSTLAWTGARAVAEDFQLLVGEEALPIRLMFSRVSEGWEVMGRLPDATWKVLRAGDSVAVDGEGRFDFRAASLADTDFVVSGPGGDFTVASAEELLARGSNQRD